MNQEKLNKAIKEYKEHISKNEDIEAINERKERKQYYQSWNKEKIKNMTEKNFYEYISQLWAMGQWGNKQYIVDKLIEDNKFEKIKNNLSELLFGDDEFEERWDRFKNNIKGFGTAMMSEILCCTYPDKYMLWNSTARNAFSNLEVESVPKYEYQITGKKYLELTATTEKIKEELEKSGFNDIDLLFVDYFFWDELKDLEMSNGDLSTEDINISVTNNRSYHNEIVEYIKNIGIMLGYNTNNSGKITEYGKIPDAVWEFNVGNIGQIKYVFEVQDSGSIDSLIVSLLNAAKDISVQAVIAVSNQEQIEKIKLHCRNLEGGFNGKIKFWNSADVEKAKEALSTSMEIINNVLNITNNNN